MTTADSVLTGRPLLHGLESLRSRWGWFLTLGILLIILGVVSLSVPLLTTLTTVLLFGILLVISGVAEVVSAFWASKWSGFVLLVLGGVLRLVVGVFLLERPGQTAAGLTLMLAVFLIVGGLVRAIFSVMERYPQWGWTTFNGVVSLLLGVLIWREWSAASLWVIGTFVGLDLLFNGWSWVMLSLAIRKLPRLSSA